MDQAVPIGQLMQIGLGAGSILVTVLAAAVWAILRQATGRFSADADELKNHLRAHAADEQQLLDRLSGEHIDTRKRVGTLHERIEGVNTEVKAIQSRLEQTPGTRDVHALAIQVTTLGGNIQAVGSKIDGLEQLMRRFEGQLGRHEEALLIERRG